MVLYFVYSIDVATTEIAIHDFTRDAAALETLVRNAAVSFVRREEGERRAETAFKDAAVPNEKLTDVVGYYLRAIDAVVAADGSVTRPAEVEVWRRNVTVQPGWFSTSAAVSCERRYVYRSVCSEIALPSELIGQTTRGGAPTLKSGQSRALQDQMLSELTDRLKKRKLDATTLPPPPPEPVEEAEAPVAEAVMVEAVTPAEATVVEAVVEAPVVDMALDVTARLAALTAEVEQADAVAVPPQTPELLAASTPQPPPTADQLPSWPTVGDALAPSFDTDVLFDADIADPFDFGSRWIAPAVISDAVDNEPLPVATAAPVVETSAAHASVYDSAFEFDEYDDCYSSYAAIGDKLPTLEFLTTRPPVRPPPMCVDVNIYDMLENDEIDEMPELEPITPPTTIRVPTVPAPKTKSKNASRRRRGSGANKKNKTAGIQQPR